MHTIYIRDLSVTATHGCYSFEKETPQQFLVSVSVHVKDWSHHDDLISTLNYEIIRGTAIAILSAAPKNLLETLADEMCDAIIKNKQALSVTVTLEKPSIFPDCVPGVTRTVARSPFQKLMARVR